MTRIDSKKKMGRAACRVAGAAVLAGTVGVALAQDSSTRYASLLAEADVISGHNGHIERLLESQQGEIAALEEQLAQMDATAVDIPALLQRMFDDLNQFVTSDVPFLETERQERIARLRDLMNQVDASPSEKYRRLMEAYQIEMEYGRTMDSYRGPLGDGREAEFVRLGRVSLLYRTDEGETGYWDNQQRMWVIDRAHRRGIEQALGIAKEEIAPDLIRVPVPAPQEARS